MSFLSKPARRLLSPHRLELRSATRRLVVFSAVLVAVLCSASYAAAQTISVPATGAGRVEPLRDDSRFPMWVNYDDCINENDLLFEVQFRNFTPGQNFQVWANDTSCVPRNERTGTNPNCWQVHQSSPTNMETTIEVSARKIVAQRRPNTPTENDPVTEAVCDKTGDSLGVPLVLTFMFVTGNNEAQGEPFLWDRDDAFQTGFDVVGPSAPTDVESGVGENRVVLTWDPQPSQTNDLLGFRFFCDTPSGAVNAATRFQLLDGGLDGSSPPPIFSGGGSDAGSALMPVTDAGGSPGSNGGTAQADGGGGTANPECPSAAVQEGLRPDDEFFCGSVTSDSATRGNAKGLENGVNHAVAVAATDLRGNVGRLSSVVCSTPTVVEDFFERYRAAGGQAGGGFCSIGATTAPGAGLWLGAAALGALARRRRRRSKKRQHD